MPKDLSTRIYDLLIDHARSMGLNIVLVRLQDRKVLEILLEKLDDTKVSIQDCQKASNLFSAVLDVEEVLLHKYLLEVSSAGVERPLVKLEDYRRFAGRQARLNLKTPILDSKKITGQIVRTVANRVVVLRDGQEMLVDFANIKSANLVLTEELFRQILKSNHT